MPKTSNLLTTCDPETSSMVPSIDSKHDIIWTSKQMALNTTEITDSFIEVPRRPNATSCCPGH